MSSVKVKNVPTYMATIENFRTIAQKTEGELLRPNVGREAYNLRFNEEYGSIEKRKNRAIYASMATLGTAKVIGAYRYYKDSDSTKHQIVAYDTFLKVGNDSTGAFTDIATGLTAGLHWTWITYKDMCYGFNGSDSNQFYDGTNNEIMGVPTPGVVSVATGAAGVLTGDYKYKVSFEIDGYQEGNASSASTQVSPSSEQVDVTSIPVSTNTRCTARFLYRTEAGGSTYYRLAKINDNTTTTYTDNIADGSLDVTISAPSDYGSPAAYKLSTLHKSRIFLARNATNKSRVIYSDVRSGTAYPDVFPVLNFFDILKDNGEEVTFIGEDNFGQLIAMKPSAVVKINTDTDDPVGWSGFNNVISPNGCVAAYSAKKTQIGIIYLSRYGEQKKRLMVWNGSAAKPIFEELEPILTAILDSRLPDIESEYQNGIYYMTYTDTSAGEIYNNRVLLIDLLTGAWVIDKKNVSCFVKWNSGTDWGELYTGTSDTAGILYREETDIEDLIIRLKSDIDKGTFDSACQSNGTEEAPTITLIKSDLDTQWGSQTVSSLSDIVSTLDTQSDNETVAPSSTYISNVLEVSAKVLLNIYWTVVHGTGGHSRLWIRTGDTEAACQAAAWNGPYLTPGGSDISAVTAAKYLQYMAKLYVEDTDDWAGTYFKRSTNISPNDYMFKISFGFGSQAESVIAMEYISHWDNFGWVNSSFKRVRKRMRAVKIEFERVSASGTLTFGYYTDGGNRTDIDFSLATYASQGYVLKNFPLGVYFNRWKYRLYNNDKEDIKIKKVLFVLSPEPYSPLL